MVNGRRSYRRRSSTPVKIPRGIFGGNKSVKFGLIAVFFCILIIQVYNHQGKRRLAGPIDDVFRRSADQLAIVYGTGGDSTEELKNYAQRVSALLGQSLKHRVPVYADDEIGSSQLEKNSLILYGPVNANRISSRFAESLPFIFENNDMQAGDRKFYQDRW